MGSEMCIRDSCIRNGTWMKRHEDVRETEEDLIKQQQEEQRRKQALGKGN